MYRNEILCDTEVKTIHVDYQLKFKTNISEICKKKNKQNIKAGT